MHTLSFSLDTLTRVLAVHRAASDADKSSTVLSGVAIMTRPSTDAVNGAHALVIAATDGKILLEERWTLDSGTLPDDATLCVSAHSIPVLSAWLKLAKKSLGKRHDCTLTLAWDGKQTVTIAIPGGTVGECQIRLVEGCFPRYDHALRPTDKPAAVERVGFLLDYYARLSDAWNGEPIEATFHRGTILRRLRLPIGCQSALGLIMPITLPS